jgi:hypothetical protein
MNESKNRKARIFAGMMLGIFAIGLALAWAPAISAQIPGAEQSSHTTVSVETPTGKLKPITQTMQLKVTVKYTWDVNMVGTQYMSPTKVAVTAQAMDSAANWCTVTVAPAEVYFSVGTPAGTSPGGEGTDTSCVLTIYFSGEAPASQLAKIQVSAVAEANGALKTSDGKTFVTVQSDYYSIIQATVPQPLQKGAPYQQITYPVTVTNLGNGKTKLFFDAKNVPTGWQVTLPPPIILEARQQGGTLTKQTVNVIIFTPYKFGYQTNVGSIKIDITSQYADDSTVKGDTTSINSMTLSKGFYVPGFDAIFMIGAIGFVALFFRRK